MPLAACFSLLCLYPAFGCHPIPIVYLYCLLPFLKAVSRPTDLIQQLSTSPPFDRQVKSASPTMMFDVALAMRLRRADSVALIRRRYVSFIIVPGG